MKVLAFCISLLSETKSSSFSASQQLLSLSSRLRPPISGQSYARRYSISSCSAGWKFLSWVASRKTLCKLASDIQLRGYRKGRSTLTMLARRQPDGAAELVEYILTKPNGVFLWVRLVVRSLLRRLAEADNLTHLRFRLQILPAELEAMYDHILREIPERYHTGAS
jgi:hypothetical protein